MTRRFTSSELKTYQRCRRSWYLKNYLGYGPKRDPGAVSVSTVGTLVHLGKEAYYKGAEEGDAVAVIEAAVTKNVEELLAAQRETAVKRVQSQGELARIMLEGYFEWLAETGADADLHVTAAEEAIEVPFGTHYLQDRFGPVSLLGKIDTRATRRSTGKQLILDTKTVAAAKDQDVMAGLNPQFKHYLLIELLREGNPAEGVLVRWLRRVKRTARATPPFYGEVPVFHSREVLRGYYQQTYALVEEILLLEERLAAGDEAALYGLQPTVDRSCGQCVFRPVCPILDDATMSATDVLGWSYDKVDPLARYDEIPEEDEE